ncbi:MAG: nucleotide exchange factor GrpE [Paludibacteraceae bacterium]|nr:nucleotide exchange factor GrpE [Paludibacteraceae bacterium]
MAKDNTENMNDKNLQEQVDDILNGEQPESQANSTDQDEKGADAATSDEAEQETPEQQIERLQKRVAELEDIRLRQMAEFDNYRRRTNKEKLELLDSAGEKLLVDILPLVDDFERARDAMAKTEDIASLREGIDLIYSKFIAWLDKQDVHAIDTTDADFNTDEHEAITTFAAGDDKKGKIIDCTQKGYKHGERVIRFAKVVVGE